MSDDSIAGYIFTESEDWFTPNRETWKTLLRYVTTSCPRVLEIGSWEGRSAVFLLTELCRSGGEFTCIDHFDLMSTDQGRERRRKLELNLSLTGKPYRVIDKFSVPGLMMLLSEEACSDGRGYDWIYIDGSHEADDTFLDGELAWRLARKGAIIIFDDYHWDQYPEESMHHPKRGIDAFLKLHDGEYTRMSSDSQYQLVIQKTTDMRIGFLVQDVRPSPQSLHDTQNSGINVALSFDSEFTVGAVVAIHSAATHTTGRITFYVAGQGLSDNVKAKLQSSISHKKNAVMKFIDLPSAPARSGAESVMPDGPMWGKIAMIPLLPVEKVLYLDADVLVRRDLKDLWTTDLCGKAIAAAPDVGFPLSPREDPDRAPYFNSGVLLLDLVRFRSSLDGLYTAAAAMKNARFHDQDALDFTPERAALDLEAMDEPGIVHFTGPVHPSLEYVMNPLVQPFSAKPWGYAGAPGHPYTEEWWSVCEETEWKGWRSSKEFKEEQVRKRDEIINEGIAAFKIRVP